jgi:hypothetical protein
VDGFFFYIFYNIFNFPVNINTSIQKGNSIGPIITHISLDTHTCVIYNLQFSCFLVLSNDSNVCNGKGIICKKNKKLKK